MKKQAKFDYGDGQTSALQVLEINAISLHHMGPVVTLFDMRRNDDHRESPRAFEQFLMEKEALAALEGREGFGNVPKLFTSPSSIVAGQHRPSPTYAQEAIDGIREKIVSDSVEPLVSASSDEEFLERLIEAAAGFWKRLRAIVVLLDDLAEEDRPPPSGDSQALLEKDALTAAISMLGEGARNEMKFAMRTFARAVALTEKIPSAGEPPDDARDGDLYKQFAGVAGIFNMLLFCLAMAPTIEARTKGGMSACLGGLRGASLACYAAVREAYELRTQAHPRQPVKLLPWDDDDHRLANAD